jgi:hypothetical protein
MIVHEWAEMKQIEITLSIEGEKYRVCNQEKKIGNG